MFFQVGRVNWGANAANTDIISAVNVVTPCGLVDDRIMSLIALTTPITEWGQVHMKESYVYILASKYKGTLYIGMTSDLVKRVWEHKNKFVSGFTAQYNVTKLVYYEIFNDIQLAAAREKRLKEWKGQWKIDLIQKMNPNWQDLYHNIIQ